MALHQLVVGASPGDAITHEAMELRTLLRRLGPSEVYARYVHPDLHDEVRELDDLPGPRETGPLIYHHSLGDRDVASLLARHPYDLVLRYHNVTPAEYFLELDPGFAALSHLGRAQLPLLRERTLLALPDSAFNAAELVDLGYPDPDVVPVLAPWERLRVQRPDPGMHYHLEVNAHAPVFLAVGQLLPHKRPDLLVEAFHLFSSVHRPDATLVLVGAARLAPYAAALRQLVRELNLANVWLMGSISNEELAACYRQADAFVTASEHEGFCVPLVEAMGFELPIVARDHGAVGDTLGGAGLLLPAGAGPELLAEAFLEVVGNDHLRADLAIAGRRRQDEFRLERLRARFLDALAGVL